MSIAQGTGRSEILCFGVGIRSHFIDDLLSSAIAAHGIRTVLSLGCGLDTRPWRLPLPQDLRWIEVDYPDMLQYKSERMASETPACRRETLAADLTDPAARHTMWTTAGSAPALMITEGLLSYLPAATIDELVSESVERSGIRYWIADLTSATFARIAGEDSVQSIQNVRAPGHIDGVEILNRMQGAGWNTLKHYSYLTDIRPIAGARMPSPPPVDQPLPIRPDDPTGVIILQHA